MRYVHCYWSGITITPSLQTELGNACMCIIPHRVTVDIYLFIEYMYIYPGVHTDAGSIPQNSFQPSLFPYL